MSLDVSPRFDPTRSRMSRRPVLLVAIGSLAACVFVLLEGHTPVVPGQVAPSRWFGLLGPVRPGVRAMDSTIAWGAILVLGACWLLLARLAMAGQLRLRVGAAGLFAWALPFLAGPPLT